MVKNSEKKLKKYYQKLKFFKFQNTNSILRIGQQVSRYI